MQMKATGIVRRIDDLGRVVIPKEIRRTLRIREGDPLEIFTDKDGEVVFKKYSPIGELGSFANEYAQSLAKTCGHSVCITDKDNVIAVSGISRKEYMDKKVSKELEQAINDKIMVVATPNDNNKLSIIDGNEEPKSGVVAPIISEGDSVGAVVIFSSNNINMGEVEEKLAESAAGFLGRTLEQ